MRTAYGFQYRVVAVLLRSMGNLEAANATHDLIMAWSPRYIVVNGIVGGLRPDSQEYGDVLVAETVVYYELGKEREKGLEGRNRHFPCDPSLLDAARNMRVTAWRDSLPARPDQRPPEYDHPRVHFGPVASGEKVIASSGAVSRLLQYQPDLVGVEMESAGVASAALGAVKSVGFLTIRAICDFADSRKSDDWQTYAAGAAASFLRAFVTTQPIGPSSGDWPRPVSGTPQSKPEDVIAQREQLFNLLRRRLDLEELNNLCFLLGLDIDELPAGRKSSRARELILRFERRGNLDRLVSALADMLNDDEGGGHRSSLPKEAGFNPIKCELALARLISELTTGTSPVFEVYRNETEIRRIIKEYLMYYRKDGGVADYPVGLKYYTGDESESYKLAGADMCSICGMLSSRGYLWTDPYTDRTYLTEQGTEMYLYLSADKGART